MEEDMALPVQAMVLLALATALPRQVTMLLRVVAVH